MEKREKMRQDMKSGELSKVEEDSLKKNLVTNVINKNVIGEEIAKTQVSLDKYERAFRKIKDATGVSDLNEVISKIINQEVRCLAKDFKHKYDVYQHRYVYI